MSTPELRLVVYEGNVKALPFRLRVKGTKNFWNVAAATQILLEYEESAGSPKLQVPCDINHAQADWANGKVVAQVSPADVTAKVGSYPFSLTVFLGTEEITAVSGHIEVKERPGFPYPPPAPVITSSLAVAAKVGTVFFYQIGATNLPTGYTAVGVPPGMSFNTATGVLQGIPTTAGIYNVMITATNAGGTDTQTLVINVAA